MYTLFPVFLASASRTPHYIRFLKRIRCLTRKKYPKVVDPPSTIAFWTREKRRKAELCPRVRSQIEFGNEGGKVNLGTRERQAKACTPNFFFSSAREQVRSAPGCRFPPLSGGEAPRHTTPFPPLVTPLDSPRSSHRSISPLVTPLHSPRCRTAPSPLSSHRSPFPLVTPLPFPPRHTAPAV
jgi:hypothetical protein